MKLLIMQSSPASRYNFPLRSKYSLQIVLKYSLLKRYQISHLNKTTSKIIVLYTLICMFL